MNTRKRWLCSLFLFQVLFSTAVMAESSTFWLAKAEGSEPVYLFGTMHSDDNRVTDFSEATLDAIKSVDVFMLETEQPKTPTPLLTRKKLSEDLSENEMDQVNALADAYVIHRAFAQHMKPWLLAVILAAPKPQTPFGQDHLLKAEAENQGKTVAALETVEAHFGVLDDVAREEQLSLLKAVLTRTQEQKEADFDKVLNAYLSGDLDKILEINGQTTGDLVKKEVWEKMKTRLIHQRNEQMADRVIEASKAQSLFVAVGASHLAGETGLVAQLTKAGFVLTPLQGLKTH